MANPDRRGAPAGWRPRLVLFDLDDTLCDYSGARLVRLRTAFAGPDPRAPLVAGAALDRLIAASLEMNPHGVDHFADLFLAHEVGDAAAADWAQHWYRTNRFHGLQAFPDAFDAIAAIRASFAGAGIRVGVVTNGPADVQRAKVERLGVDRIADFVLISGEFGAWKPDRAIFAEALRLGAAAPREAVMVGDSLEHDVAGARAVGIQTVWINQSGRPRRKAESAPDEEVHAIAEVPAVLERWRSAPGRP